MNSKYQIAAVAVVSIAVGFSTGYLVARALDKKHDIYDDQKSKEADRQAKEEYLSFQRDAEARHREEPTDAERQAEYLEEQDLGYDSAVLIPSEPQELTVYDEYSFDEEEPTEKEPTTILNSDDEDEKASDNLTRFIEKYRNRVPSEYGGVTFPGQVTDDQEPEASVSAVPGFVTVRDPHGPYVISIDQYMEDDSPFSKIELTYFDGDDTLIDSREQIVQDVNGTIGSKNLEKFGQGTTDTSQVYIRNERLEIDIEVTRDTNTYSRAVLGIIPKEELARSMTKPLKMREGDDN